MAESPTGPSAVEVAIRFMTEQNGGPERVLRIHRRLADGRCRGCLTTVTTWPCPVARLALRARAHGGVD
ncbi:hypothetical protein BJF90_22215 [Pseudonocardia sp. CNS-004]|nr:hypothetical protein BJF90_22215 [Pseudonocardia sp. CNS-004]